MSFLNFILACLGFAMVSDPMSCDFKKVFKIVGTYKFYLENHNGKVDIKAHESEDLIIVATIINYNKQEPISKIVCTQIVQGQCIIVSCKTESPRSMFTVGQPEEVNYTIFLPKKACQQLTVNIHNGAITTDGIQAFQALRSHNGAITIRSSGNKIDATTHNGAITVKNANAIFNLVTHNGAIIVNIEQEITGDCSARTHNGSIQILGSKFVDGKLDTHTYNGCKSIA